MAGDTSMAGTHTLDRTGVIASVGCAIHCALAPALLLFAPTLGGWWAHPSTHLAIAMLVLPIAGAALYRGFGDHAKRWILTVGALGMLLVTIGTILPFAGTSDACCPVLIHDPVTGETTLHVPAATILTLLGGIALITAHVANIRAACKEGCAHH